MRGLGPTLLALGAAPVAAQNAPPQPIVTVEELAAAEKDLGDPRKYWVLHKPGVSVEQASADLTFCWRFVPHGVQRSTPSFVPWRKRDANRPVSYTGGPYGLVGAAIGAIISGPLERSIRQSRMFRCMVPRGYARYRVTEDLWKRIYQAEPAQAIATLAAIASGPMPPTPEVTQ